MLTLAWWPPLAFQLLGSAHLPPAARQYALALLLWAVLLSMPWEIAAPSPASADPNSDFSARSCSAQPFAALPDTPEPPPHATTVTTSLASSHALIGPQVSARTAMRT
jgi:hypothetical protein